MPPRCDVRHSPVARFGSIQSARNCRCMEFVHLWRGYYVVAAAWSAWRMYSCITVGFRKKVSAGCKWRPSIRFLPRLLLEMLRPPPNGWKERSYLQRSNVHCPFLTTGDFCRTPAIVSPRPETASRDHVIWKQRRARMRLKNAVRFAVRRRISVTTGEYRN